MKTFEKKKEWVEDGFYRGSDKSRGIMRGDEAVHKYPYKESHTPHPPPHTHEENKRGAGWRGVVRYPPPSPTAMKNITQMDENKNVMI